MTDIAATEIGATDNAALVDAFVARRLDNRAFHHRDHVVVAYELLRRSDFVTATARYADTIRELAKAAGAPEKYNATITFAFMSLIAERMATTEHADADDFIAGNPDLLSGQPLNRWYAPERLRSDLARRVFLLPEAR